MARSSHRRLEVVSDVALFTMIVAAPLASGSWRIETLPLLCVLAMVACTTTVLALRVRRSPLRIPTLALGLAALAAFTALQAAPLGAALSAVSPHAADVRNFAASRPSGPITYEVSATLRDAARLLLYGIIVFVAAERSRRERGRELVALALVAGGLASIAVAIVHRVFRIEDLFGVLSMPGTMSRTLTTFSNSNHAAGYLTLTTLAALGMAISNRNAVPRIAFSGAAALASFVSVMTMSKGGFIALGSGLVLFALSLKLGRREGGEDDAPRITPAIVVAAIVVPLLGVVWRLDGILHELRLADSLDAPGVRDKLAALEQALPMIRDHAWVGIGRGSFVSVHTQYKESPLQLTFAFPENIALQLLSEWGFVIGGAALGGLLFAALIRFVDARQPLSKALIAAVGAVLLHNVVDFSLEIPAVAIAVAAILGVVGPARSRWALRFRARTVASTTMALLVPIGLLAGAGLGAFEAGDLQRDLERLERTEPPASSDVLAEVEGILERHPANAIVAARAAYLNETASPARLERAMRLANRTLFLAPTYADGHMVTGRLLVRGGHRDQGFGELRRGWTLSQGSRGRHVDHVISLARRPAEILRAAPRRDVARDVADEIEVARAVRHLVSAGRMEWALALLALLPPTDEIEPDALYVLATSALQASALDRAAELTRRLQQLEPDSPQARLLHARVLRRRAAWAELHAFIMQLPDEAQDDLSFLRLRLEAASALREWESARRALELMRRLGSQDRHVQAELTLREAQLERLAGQPYEALRILGDGLARDPSDIGLRLERAQILLILGRAGEGRADLSYVLQRDPDNAAARRMLEAHTAATTQ